MCAYINVGLPPVPGASPQVADIKRRRHVFATATSFHAPPARASPTGPQAGSRDSLRGVIIVCRLRTHRTAGVSSPKTCVSLWQARHFATPPKMRAKRKKRTRK
ncbi:hypothetical protein MRX96_059825 [Rhipicephalus microplus]